MPHDILSNEQLEELLEELIGVVLSSRRTADDIAAQLAVFPRTQQDFVLRWVKVVAASNAELAYQFAQRAAAALTRANTADIEAWAVHAMDVFDRGGLHAAVAHLNDFEAFIHQRKIMAAGLPFNEVVGVLRNFLQGLPGRTLKLDGSAQVYTDTESVFLAPVAGLFQSREDNFRWYKACAVAMWAQSYYGTWNVAWNEVIARYPDPQRALCALHALELVRLDACLARDLPGVHRDMMRLRTLRTETLDLTFDPALMAQLRMQHTSVTDSLSLLPQAYAAAWRVSVCYQGEMLPERVMATRAARIAREKNALRLALAKLSADAQRPATKPIEMGGDSAQPQRFRAVRSAPEAPDDFTFELQLDGQPMIPPDDVQSLVASIIQDLGQVPEDYLVAAGDGPYDAAHQAAPRDPRDVWKGTYHEEGAHFYPEWDCERQQYRKNWAVLRELDGHPLWDDFPAAHLAQVSRGGAATAAQFRSLARRRKSAKAPERR